MMKRLLFISYALCSFLFASAQYAPQAGIVGSAAIYDTSRLFVGWATHCTVHRGYMNIADTALGLASSGDSSAALGFADDFTVSLGDSGMAIVSFASPIYDAPGADFAVFENGFLNASNDSLAFLELGFVEVSSDSIHFVRFPATSLTQNKLQMTNDSFIYANQLNNLAGSYIALYGTPFDLQELADSPNLDINNVRFVRIIDVVGSISGHSTYDASGRVINDPYPTPFPSCGFDLDAVGVIHQKAKAAVINISRNVSINTYPDPVTDKFFVEVMDAGQHNLRCAIVSVMGKMMQEFSVGSQLSEVSMSEYPSGIYYLYVYNTDGSKWAGKIIKE